VLESHCCLPDRRWHLSGGQAYGERWRFKGVEEVGEPQDVQGRGEGSGTRWKGVGQGAVRFVFNIDARLMLGFELKVGFKTESNCKKRVMVSCESIGNLIFWV